MLIEANALTTTLRRRGVYYSISPIIFNYFVFIVTCIFDYI